MKQIDFILMDGSKLSLKKKTKQEYFCKYLQWKIMGF